MGDLMQAYKFGSLIHIDKELKEQLSQVKERALGETFDSTQKLKKKIVEGNISQQQTMPSTKNSQKTSLQTYSLR